MHVLIANDDGIFAPGIRALAKAAAAAVAAAALMRASATESKNFRNAKNAKSRSVIFGFSACSMHKKLLTNDNSCRTLFLKIIVSQ